MLCQLAHQFPLFVENFLERGRGLRRRFREETVTDLLMGSLIAAGGVGIVVEFPDEPATGADMEWNFVNPDDGTFFRILLQAKQAYGEGSFWKRHCYRELLHTSGSGSTLQATTLCDTARTDAATYPLYIFYHRENTCSMARGAGFPNVTGASLADGYEIERLVLACTNRALRTSNKSVGRIAPLLFTLPEIFSPTTILPLGPMAFAPAAASISTPMYMARMVMGRPMPPTPEQIRERLIAAMKSSGDGGQASDAPYHSVPPVSSEIPQDVLRTLEGRRGSIGHGSGLNRWCVTFVSRNPPDLEGELEKLKHLQRSRFGPTRP